MNEFRKELETLINRHSMENGCSTPDFILADFLVDCLGGFDRAVNARTKWYRPETIAPEAPSTRL